MSLVYSTIEACICNTLLVVTAASSVEPPGARLTFNVLVARGRVSRL